MKTACFTLLMLSSCLLASAFEIITPEVKKADKAWEASIRRRFDLEKLHQFLIATIADQKRKEDVDLTASRVAAQWDVQRHQRILLSGDWYFVGEGGTDAFQLRYYYGKEDEVVFVCRRVKKDVFSFLEVKIEPARFVLQ